MTTLFIFLTITLTIGALAYLRSSLALATIALAVVLLLLTKITSGVVPGGVVTVMWLIGLAFASLNIRWLRQRLISAPALAFFRSAPPEISSIEQEALDAGTVWWAAELFSGNPDWNRLLQLPAEKLSDIEQAFLDGPVSTLCSMVNDWEVSRSGELPQPVWQYLKGQGFLGMIIPREYGGKDFSARAHSRVIEKIASRSGTAAVSVMVSNSLGPAELLLRYGSEAQKNHYLPRLASGEDAPCFAPTNPFVGSDAAAIPDTGIVCHGQFNGEEVLGIRVTWENCYITLSPIASLLGLPFHLYDPDKLIGETNDVGITLALLPGDHPGELYLISCDLKRFEDDGRIVPHAEDRVADAVAAGIISEIEAKQIRSTAAAVRRAIDVDDFSSEELWQVNHINDAKADAA